MSKAVKKNNNKTDFWTAVGLLTFVAVGIFTSFSYIFVSITGEKQQIVFNLNDHLT